MTEISDSTNHRYLNRLGDRITRNQRPSICWRPIGVKSDSGQPVANMLADVLKIDIASGQQSSIDNHVQAPSMQMLCRDKHISYGFSYENESYQHVTSQRREPIQTVHVIDVFRRCCTQPCDLSSNYLSAIISPTILLLAISHHRFL